MKIDPKGLEQAIAAAFCTRENGNIDFDAAIATAINAYLEAAPSPSPAPGVVEALREAAERFEEIRLLLVHHLHEPERSAFWKAVDGRTKCQAALASLSQPAKERDEFNEFGYDPAGPEAGAGFRVRGEREGGGQALVDADQNVASNEAAATPANPAQPEKLGRFRVHLGHKGK